MREIARRPVDLDRLGRLPVVLQHFRRRIQRHWRKSLSQNLDEATRGPSLAAGFLRQRLIPRALQGRRRLLEIVRPTRLVCVRQPRPPLHLVVPRLPEHLDGVRVVAATELAQPVGPLQWIAGGRRSRARFPKNGKTPLHGFPSTGNRVGVSEGNEG